MKEDKFRRLKLIEKGLEKQRGKKRTHFVKARNKVSHDGRWNRLFRQLDLRADDSSGKESNHENFNCPGLPWRLALTQAIFASVETRE